jgi:hypothetical protein
MDTIYLNYILILLIRCASADEGSFVEELPTNIRPDTAPNDQAHQIYVSHTTTPSLGDFTPFITHY